MPDLVVTAVPDRHLIRVTVSGAPAGARRVDVVRVDAGGLEEPVPNDARPEAGVFDLVDGAAIFGQPTRFRATVSDASGTVLASALSDPVTLSNLGSSVGVVGLDVDPANSVEVKLLLATDGTRSWASDSSVLTPINGAPPVSIGAPGRLETTVSFAVFDQVTDRAVEDMVASGLPVTIRVAGGDPDVTWVARRRFRHAPGQASRARLSTVTRGVAVWESSSTEVGPSLRPPIPAVTWADWVDDAALAGWTEADIAQACAAQGFTARDTIGKPLNQIMGE
ncbi:MAG: hypothetical protein LBK54_10275 [Propionibacteriaceae bacterium]|jgi:hypothetical protein|nr:hypothetical protein [Propionibacteriaceae bacterium]